VLDDKSTENEAMTTQDQIDSFHRFATKQLANGRSEKSVDELFDQWRYENLRPEEHVENVAAIQASINDMNNGQTGRDAAEVEKELRTTLNLPE
jgi:hypothetical protein